MHKNIIETNNLFEQSWWLDIVAEGRWQYIVIEEEGEIVARLPYVIKKIWYGTIIEMPILTQTLGFWIKEVSDKNAENLSFQNKNILKILEKLPQCKYFKIRIAPENKYVLPFIWKGCSVKTVFSYRIEDLKDLDNIYTNFSKTAKKNIKSAEKKVKLRYDLDEKILIEMLDITFAHQGRKYPNSKEVIKKIVTEAKKNDACRLIAAEDSLGNVHACSLFVYDKKVCYYLISGSNPQFRTSGAQTLILWDAIKFAATRSKIFDFEGSMIEGIEKFFRQFGGVPIPYYEVRKIPIIFEMWEIFKPKIKKMIGYK